VEGDLLVGKVAFTDKITTALQGYQSMMDEVDNTAFAYVKNLSLRVDSEAEGRIVDIAFVPKNIEVRDSFTKLKISIASLRKIEVGDKLSGRHGNKGVIARIASRADMPILPDGTTLDILVNPLGVPSRMNVGQILECLLGFAGKHLSKRFKVIPFDEIYGKDASAILVHEKLKQARSVSSIDWLLNSAHPGKIFLRDGRTGEYFDNPTTVGYAYILKLVHTIESKFHSRNTGPYNKVTQQPLGGRSRDGGQRLGEMEVWALEAHGCSHTLQELLSIKSDDIEGRVELETYLLSGRQYKKPMSKLPETFSLLIHELNALGLNIEFNKYKTQYSSLTETLSFNQTKSYEDSISFNKDQTQKNINNKIKSKNSGRMIAKLPSGSEQLVNFTNNEEEKKEGKTLTKKTQIKKQIDLFNILETRLKIKSIM
jgi:DNA-directed RNA polymerase subunit beta